MFTRLIVSDNRLGVNTKNIEKRWGITCTDIRPGVYGPLFCSVTHPQGSRPCRAAPTSLKYDFKDACEILDNLFIDTTTLK